MSAVRLVAALARPEGRAAGPGRVALAGLGALAVAVLAALLADARWPGWAAAALAAGTAALLEDPLEETGAAAPTPLPVRRALRVALALPLLAVAWLAVLAVAGAEARPVDSLMAAALVAATLGTAAAGLRTRLAERARAAAMAVPLLVVGAGTALPGPPPWQWTAGDWAPLLVAGAVALAWSSRSA